MTSQDDAPGRTVRLVLCTAQDGVLGVLPPYDVPLPYWQEAHDVVAGARERFGLDVVVLRLLRGAVGVGAFGGAVTYLAQVDAPVPPAVLAALTRWDGSDPLAPQAHRAPYAELDGPRRDLSWALAALDAAGARPTAPPRQVRTWNLSSLWELATDAGRFWLKAVPSFYRHEGPLLRHLRQAGFAVPDVVAAEPGRVLMAEVPGEDQYGAPAERVAELVPLLVDVQARLAAGPDAGLPDVRSPDAELTRIGLPDGDLAALPDRVTALVRRLVEEPAAAPDAVVDVPLRRDLDRLLADLPDLVRRIAGCGLPRTLVHGDFHPGNVRGVPGRFAILDWGDAELGDPSRDVARIAQGLDGDGLGLVLDAMRTAWQRAVPGCDPVRAGELAVPLAPLQSALCWQGFLDRIEPDERPYHEGDPAAGLRQAVRLARAGWA